MEQSFHCVLTLMWHFNSYIGMCHGQRCGLRLPILGQDRSETKKEIGLGLAGLVLQNTI